MEPKTKAPAPLRDPGPYIVTDRRDALVILTSDAQLSALLSGAGIPLGERKTRDAKPGEWVTDLPAVSVAALLAEGKIRKPTPAELEARKPKPVKEAS